MKLFRDGRAAEFWYLCSRRRVVGDIHLRRASLFLGIRAGTAALLGPDSQSTPQATVEFSP